MFRYMIPALVLVACSPLAATAQQADDPTAIEQIQQTASDSEESVTPDQLNQKMTRILRAAQIEQLDTQPPGIDIQQADGGEDVCASDRAADYKVCREAEGPARRTRSASRESQPEEDYAAATSRGIELFSSDPTLTADQIGRGKADTFAAQSLADEMLPGRKPDEEAELPLSVEGLPPDVLTDFGNGPVITEGN